MDKLRWFIPLIIFGSYGCSDAVVAAETTAAGTTSGTGGFSASETSAAGTDTGEAPTTTAADSSTSTTAGSTAATTGAGPTCGDGVLDPGEQCDDGPANADEAACSWSCERAFCGDDRVQTGVEACDDGINDGGYNGCLADCSARGPHCGDDIIQPEFEACEASTLGPFCNFFCEAVICEWLPLIPPTTDTCPPAAQQNATISGDTPLGPFAGTFAAQAFDHSAWTLVVAPAYADDSLCGQPHLLVSFDDPSVEAPGASAVHALVVTADASALATGTITVLSDDYMNFDADSDCAGTTTLELSVEADGWSLSGTIEASCCWSGDNFFVR